MTKIHKRKVNVFGRKIPVLLIAAIIVVGLATAALIPYFGQITGKATVSQGLEVDNHTYQDSVVESWNGNSFTSLEERTYVTMHELENYANVSASVYLNDNCGTGLSGNDCNGVNVTYYVPAKDSIIETANRLVLLQNESGSWDWDVTGDTGPTSTFYLNIAGVTAQGLLTAYSMTGDSTYLDAAEKTGSYLINTINVADTSQRQNAYNVVFLYRLASITGNSSYSDKANEVMQNTISQANYWASHNGAHCTASGCTAQQLFDALEEYRGGDVGITLWDMAPFVSAAESYGNLTWANNMKAAIELGYSTLDSSSDYYALGLSGVVSATGNTSATQELIANQSSDGSWGGWIQDTAYAVMALKSVGELAPALNGQAWLASKDVSGVFKDDGAEYAEVDSEAIQAIPYEEVVNPLLVEAHTFVPFVISTHFQRLLVPDTYTITTEVTA